MKEDAQQVKEALDYCRLMLSKCTAHHEKRLDDLAKLKTGEYDGPNKTDKEIKQYREQMEAFFKQEIDHKSNCCAELQRRIDKLSETFWVARALELMGEE
jgi:polyhydroxyalkanoate synthesis regulator phasin